MGMGCDKWIRTGTSLSKIGESSSDVALFLRLNKSKVDVRLVVYSSIMCILNIQSSCYGTYGFNQQHH